MSSEVKYYQKVLVGGYVSNSSNIKHSFSSAYTIETKNITNDFYKIIAKGINSQLANMTEIHKDFDKTITYTIEVMEYTDGIKNGDIVSDVWKLEIRRDIDGEWRIVHEDMNAVYEDGYFIGYYVLNHKECYKILSNIDCKFNPLTAITYTRVIDTDKINGSTTYTYEIWNKKISKLYPNVVHITTFKNKNIPWVVKGVDSVDIPSDIDFTLTPDNYFKYVLISIVRDLFKKTPKEKINKLIKKLYGDV